MEVPKSPPTSPILRIWHFSNLDVIASHSYGSTYWISWVTWILIKTRLQTALVKLNNPQWLYLELKINIKNRNRLYFFDMHLGHGPSMAFMSFTYSFLQYSLDFSGLLVTLLTIHLQSWVLCISIPGDLIHCCDLKYHPYVVDYQCIIFSPDLSLLHSRILY